MHRKKTLSLKKAYYQNFIGKIVIPLVLVLLISLLILGQQFKSQAIENIERAQQTVVTELMSDVDFMSMRLSQLINANDNMMIRYAAETDTMDRTKRHEYQNKLDESGNLMMEPVRDIVSLVFYMKSGREIYLKNEIKQSREEIQNQSWYQAALANPNSVKLGTYQTLRANDMYQGGSKDLFVLIYAISPDQMIDRSQKVEMVVFYQTTDVGRTIRNYNSNYLKHNNNLGIMRIVDADGGVIYSAAGEIDETAKGFICVRTPVPLGDTNWYVESYIKISELLKDFMRTAVLVILVAILIFALAGYFAGYFIKQIVNPIGELSEGLRQIEDGKLDIHIVPTGQAEIRTVIHHFNAMVRSLKSLIEEYKEKVRQAEWSAADCLAALIRGEMTPVQVEERNPDFFAEAYLLISLHFEQISGANPDKETAAQVMQGFERNPRYTLHCIGCLESAGHAYLMYRIMESDYHQSVVSILKELQVYARQEKDMEMSACIGEKSMGAEAFGQAVSLIREKEGMQLLYGKMAIVSLEEEAGQKQAVWQKVKEYQKLADALYSADDKNYIQEKGKLLESLGSCGRSEAENILCAAILAVAFRFEADGIKLREIFGQKYNYVDKLERLEDVRSMKMWITNYLNWVMDYSSTKIDALETDAIVKAKRYLSDHYDDAELTLAKVADHVGLNEKYFTNRFTKESGETFSNYLTQLRMAKARELLRTTSFKVYEIAEMVGYHNAEHFTRMFKKEVKLTPAQYRKHGDIPEK